MRWIQWEWGGRVARKTFGFSWRCSMLLATATYGGFLKCLFLAGNDQLKLSRWLSLGGWTHVVTSLEGTWIGGIIRLMCTTFSGRDCVYLLLPGTLSLCAEDRIVFGIIRRRRRTIMCVISSMSNPRFSWWNQLKSTILAPQIHHVLHRIWRRPGTYDLVRKNCWGSRTVEVTHGDPQFLLHRDGHWLVSYLVNGLIPSLQKLKDPLNGSNGMWKFPTKPWFLRWCWILAGRDYMIIFGVVCGLYHQERL